MPPINPNAPTVPMGLTDETTAEEQAAIEAAYTITNPDGTVTIDYDALDDAIQAYDPANHTYSIEDMIAVYVAGRQQLPTALATAGSLADPDAYAHLWSYEVRSSLQQLGDVYTDQADEIAAFLALDPRDAVARGEDLLNRILESMDDADDPEEFRNLFNPQDLSEVMSLFMGFGNPGLALLLYTAYGLSPAMQDLQESALEVMEDAELVIEDVLSEMQTIGADDEDAQSRTQALQRQMEIARSVQEMMREFIRNAQQSIDQSNQMASNLSEQTTQAQMGIIRNMA